MKKIFVSLFIALLFINGFMLTACATDYSTDDFVYSEFYEKIDSQTKEFIEELGINESDYKDLLELSPRKIIELLIDMIKGKWKEPFKAVGLVACISALSSVVNTLNISNLKNENLFGFFEASLILVSIAFPLSSSLTAAVSAMKLLSNFMMTYIPVFAGVVSASGLPLSAFSYNAVLISFTEFSSKFLTSYTVPCVFLLTVISICSSTGREINVTDIISVVKKTVTVSLSMIAGIFTGLLSLKSKISLAADSVAVKGIKLLSGSIVPIVGGAVGDAFSSVLGSFALIKNTVGVFGIIVILCMILPSLVSLVMWYLSLSIASFICDFTGSKATSDMIKSINSGISLVNTVLIFFTTVFVISTGIMLNLRS